MTKCRFTYLLTLRLLEKNVDRIRKLPPPISAKSQRLKPERLGSPLLMVFIEQIFRYLSLLNSPFLYSHPYPQICLSKVRY
jgi:hypothetical protein